MTKSQEEILAEAIDRIHQKRFDALPAPIREAYKVGYIEALNDYAIWNDGVQRIGCRQTPIKEIIERKFGPEHA